MAVCGNCNTQLQEGVTFCPMCGAPVPVFDEAKDAGDNKTMGILSYILWFLPLITGDVNKSPFVKFHANQGLDLFILAIGYSVASTLLRWIFRLIFRYGAIYSILSAVTGLASLAILVLLVMGILNAVNGQKKPLPIIGGITLLK